MAINKDEIDKYIFDPENPKQCKSYKLLLKISARENGTYFSPDFLKYFYKNEIVNQNFKEELWDEPKGFDDLSLDEKMQVFVDGNSFQDLIEFIESNKEIQKEKLTNFQFFYNWIILSHPDNRTGYLLNVYMGDLDNIHSSILSSDKDINRKKIIDVQNEKLHYLFFSFNYLSLLVTNVKKTSMIITLEKNIEEFLAFEGKNSNIKPIFLKKVEDIDILLNVLEQDLKKEKQRNLPQENILTLNEIIVKDFLTK